jgi:hypothetical protein
MENTQVILAWEEGLSRGSRAKKDFRPRVRLCEWRGIRVSEPYDVQLQLLDEILSISVPDGPKYTFVKAVSVSVYRTSSDKSTQEILYAFGGYYMLSGRIPPDIGSLVLQEHKVEFGGLLTGLVPPGFGETEKQARDDAALKFHEFVRKSWWTLPHERTVAEEDRARLIGQLVDWRRFREDNPPQEFVLGEIIELKKKTVIVHWHCGYAGKNEFDDEIRGTIIYANLGTDVSVGSYFGAKVRAYPNRLEWIEYPYPIPHEQFDRSKLQKAKTSELWPREKTE